jgi:hypothetical protein
MAAERFTLALTMARRMVRLAESLTGSAKEDALAKAEYFTKRAAEIRGGAK